MQIYTNSPIVEGLTFDDVLLIPAHSDVLPREVDVSTRLTREIRLHTPIVSAAMDTVTEADLAIAIAREGGIGVIHKNMPIEVQMEQVRKVKRAENGMIYDPVTIRENATVGDALNLMHENHIGGIPVVNARGMLCGIVTNRDLRFQDNPKTPVADVMTKENLITTTDGTNLKEATELLRRYKIEKLLVVDKEGRLAGLITYKDIMKIKDNPTASKDAKGRLLVAAAVGINSESVQKVEMLMSVEPDALVFDTAHGHSEGVLRVLKTVRQKFPDLQIIAGNIATGEAASALKECGVDAVKVGIGPGSICTTRIIAGVGVPQLSAVMMVAEALKGSGIPIIADGGIRYSGDIVKALAAGADTIMAGSLFAGVEESPGETIILNGRPGTLQGHPLGGCLPAGGRTPLRYGILWSPQSGGAQEGPLRAHHRRRYGREPSPRRDHHPRGSQLHQVASPGNSHEKGSVHSAALPFRYILPSLRPSLQGGRRRTGRQGCAV